MVHHGNGEFARVAGKSEDARRARELQANALAAVCDRRVCARARRLVCARAPASLRV